MCDSYWKKSFVVWSKSSIFLCPCMRSPQCGGIFSGESWPLNKEVPGHPDPEITGAGEGGGWFQKKDVFSALQASVWSKNKGGGAPLHPALTGRHLCQERKFGKSYGSENLRSKNLIKSNDLLGSRTCLYWESSVTTLFLWSVKGALFSAIRIDNCPTRIMQMQGYLSCARIWWELTDANLVSIDSVFFKNWFGFFFARKSNNLFFSKNGCEFWSSFVCLYFFL